MDEEVTVGNGVGTSRKPNDIPAFNREMIKLFSEGVTASAETERKAA